MNASYASPNEYDESYVRRVDRFGRPIAGGENAVRSGVYLTRNATALGDAYDQAAKNFWRSVNSSGSASDEVRWEYAYWIERRRMLNWEARFVLNGTGDIGRIVTGMSTLGAKEPEELVDLWNSSGDNSDYFKAAAVLDMDEHSLCKWIYSENRYHRALAQTVPDTLSYIRRPQYYFDIVDRLDLESYSDEDFTQLLIFLSSGRKFANAEEVRSALLERSDSNVAREIVLGRLDCDVAECTGNRGVNEIFSARPEDTWTFERRKQLGGYLQLFNHLDRDQKVYAGNGEFMPDYQLTLTPYEFAQCTQDRLMSAAETLTMQPQAQKALTRLQQQVGSSLCIERGCFINDSIRIAAVSCLRGEPSVDIDYYVGRIDNLFYKRP